MGDGIVRTLLNLYLLAFTALMYAEIYVLTNADVISQLTETNPLEIIIQLGLMLVAWILAVRPAIEKMLGRTISYNAMDWQRHVISFLVLGIAAYIGLSKVMADSQDVGGDSIWIPWMLIAFLVIPYALTEFLVHVIVNGPIGREKTVKKPL